MQFLPKTLILPGSAFEFVISRIKSDVFRRIFFIIDNQSGNFYPLIYRHHLKFIDPFQFLRRKTAHQSPI